MTSSVIKRTAGAAALCAALLLGGRVLAHCEIPCGIYGDRMRVEMLEEHFRTVEKSMAEIRRLEAAEDGNANQLVRWIVNKEEHANEIQHIVYQYFMNQRVTPVDENAGKAYERYVAQITLLHRMLVQAMYCKQTTDAEHVQKLSTLLHAFEHVYFEEPEEHSHHH
ncbi:MAG: superoxide dismutase [Lentisphaerae bacterium]|nr:superoxide dismutase [Lentisphaerota bacterium]